MSEEEDCILLDDDKNYKSITCSNIPEEFLNKQLAKEHFSQFGNIKHFLLRPRLHQCTVEYEREEEAEEAQYGAADYNGHEMSIDFTTIDKPQPKTVLSKWLDPDIQSELSAMSNNSQSQAQRSLKFPPASTKFVPKSVPPQKKPTVTTQQSMDPTVKRELESILKSRGTTAEEKYRILDARDKLIRLKTIRQTDVQKAVSTKGSCQDMCPEKERLMREYQKQVSSYESDKYRGSMVHKYGIKQYARSSADQETPLSHELRTEKALKMTMVYMLREIMDKCDSVETNLGEWFHFVWDRTRSIRKDITQQELCSLEAVELVEQCARFHIHCAARLVAEDPSVFDAKINTENLTKCLQSLKYMYHDLRLKGVNCPRESEFRAYIVLLNLNDANFLWEVNQLPDSIQKSQEVKQSIQFYLAVANNNYVKFFELLKKSSYLFGCILLRYFTQIRVLAIKIMLKAYNRPSSIALDYLTMILGFNTVDETKALYSSYGLEFDEEERFLKLDKNSFYQPDFPVASIRSELVDNKRIYSVGETVCGHPIEDSSIFENHEPHNSFDDSGFLLGTAWAADDQQLEPISISTSEVDSSVFKVPSKTPPVSPKVSKSLIKSSGFGSTGTPFGTTGGFGSKFPPSFDQSNNSLFGTSTFIAPKVAPQIPSGPTKEEIEAAEREKERLRQQQRQEELERKIKEENERLRILEQEKLRQIQLKKEFEEQERLRIEKETQERIRKENERAQKIQRINENSEEILRSIVGEVMKEESKVLAIFESRKFKDFLENANQTNVALQEEVLIEFLKSIVKEELELLKKQQSNILHKYFTLWLDTTRRHKEQRRLISELPSWSYKDPTELAHPKQEETLDSMKRYRLGIPLELNIDQGRIFDSKLNFNKIFATQFSKESPPVRHGLVKHHKFYKLLLSVPSDKEEKYGFGTFMNSWIKRNVEISEDIEDGSLISEFKENVGLCCKKVEGINDSQIKEGHCNNFDGTLFIMTCVNLENSKKRLHNLLLNSKNFKPIPLVIVVYNGNVSSETLVKFLELDFLTENEYISLFEIVGTNEKVKEPELVFVFDGCLKFLANNYSPFDELEMQLLTSFVSVALTDELFSRFEESWKSNPHLKKHVTSSPHYVIRLYNEAIDQIITIIDQDFSLYAEFPDDLRKFVPKFDADIPGDFEQFPKSWKNSKRIANIKSLLNKIKLGKVNSKVYPQQWIPDFAKTCLSTADAEHTEKIGLGAIQIFLETQSLSSFSWFPIIKHISIAVLNHVWASMFRILPNEVIYPRNTFDHFLTQPWWLELDWIKSLKVDRDDYVQKEQIVPVLNDSEVFQEILRKGHKTLRKADRKLKRLEDFSASIKESTMNVSEIENSLMDESLYNFEVNSVLSKMGQKESSPPRKKRFKCQNDDLDFDSVIQRALMVSNRVEKRLDARKDFL
ncbi:MCM3AP family protein [Megaselia abdita]